MSNMWLPADSKVFSESKHCESRSTLTFLLVSERSSDPTNPLNNDHSVWGSAPCLLCQSVKMAPVCSSFFFFWFVRVLCHLSENWRHILCVAGSLLEAQGFQMLQFNLENPTVISVRPVSSSQKWTNWTAGKGKRSVWREQEAGQQNREGNFTQQKSWFNWRKTKQTEV